MCGRVPRRPHSSPRAPRPDFRAMLDERLTYCFWGLRLGCGVQSIVSGVLKFNSGEPLVRVAGVIELVAGVLIFTPLTTAAARFIGGWLLLLALYALSVRHAYDAAVFDVLLAAGALVLARLTRVNEASVEELAVAGARVSG